MPNTHKSQAALLPLLYSKDISNITGVFVSYKGDIAKDDIVTKPENSIIAVFFMYSSKLCITVNCEIIFVGLNFRIWLSV